MKRKLGVILGSILAVVMCACSKNTAIDDSANYTSTENVNNSETGIIQLVSEEKTIDADYKKQYENENLASEYDLNDPMYWKVLNPNHSEYENPYVYTEEEYDTPKSSLYWELQRNGIKLVNRVAKELSDKNWDNIKSCYGYPVEFIKRGEYLSPAEREMFLFTVYGSVNDGMIDAIVIIGLSEDKPEGEVCRVIQAGNGRQWWPECNGYEENEIVDAYTLGLWEMAYSY